LWQGNLSLPFMKSNSGQLPSVETKPDQGKIGEPENQTDIITVAIKNFSFNPAELQVKKGTVVIWQNEDSAPHTIKFSDFSSEVISRGQSYEHQFNSVGTSDYICSIHPSMKGKIIVGE